MVFKIDKDMNMNNDLNESFLEVLKNNIENKRQSVIFITGGNSITVNSRGCKVTLKDDALLVYRDELLKDIIDINCVLAIVTK